MNSADAQPLLAVRGLSAGYGGPRVLHGIDLDLWPSRITALLGPNGAGKTTLMRAVCGAVHSSGQIRLQGRDVADHKTERIARLGVAHVPEGRGTFADLTVDENLRVGGFARAARQTLRQAIDRVYDWLPRLAERREQRAGSLSGGEQQMLAIGRALVADPKVLLLDEPSFGLAPRVTAEVMQLLRKLQQETPLGILLVEQNAVAALKLADHAYVLSGGRITASAPAAELQGSAALQAAYLGGTA
ncbi:ABC transporter ATP-binding protein [Pseudorhodoferax sp.]|uniref:ABC transporter ATP-binding protein n=1 Tax=Pseudorhodoferax sp. TaxID=1993553 RepID=UPI002DD64A59|nr:ABC transporter ATP-binding protein [Pseudorhodoferax sp.]